jgi:hypothetical protein
LTAVDFPGATFKIRIVKKGERGLTFLALVIGVHSLFIICKIKDTYFSETILLHIMSLLNLSALARMTRVVIDHHAIPSAAVVIFCLLFSLGTTSWGCSASEASQRQVSKREIAMHPRLAEVNMI